MEIKNQNIQEPYKGLQPYEEEDQELFFGRDAEREILIDKILSDKLTLLFAATGVGKSSLLQASVLPELKRADRENLDVVYFRDWVSEPFATLKDAVLEALRKSGKVSSDYRLEGEFSLKDFFHICTTFSSEPLVVILDQFEEFFQYQRYKEAFEPFVKALAESINDRQTSVVFVISMREDFALELNAFKDYLPTTLFENYFRLEKLKIENAQKAITGPVEKFGFKYEKELLKELLDDLAQREKKNRFGISSDTVLQNIPLYVEPPYLQIVCTHMWKADLKNPEKRITQKTYEQIGKAAGLTDSYFDKVIKSFSPLEKAIASRAFNHLVTQHGTKMAYPVAELSSLIRIKSTDLESVLEKLRLSKILRDQKREGVVWYELYHDIFSSIIFKWNETYKAQQRNKKTFITAGSVVFLCIILFFSYDCFMNFTRYHLRLSSKVGVSDNIELYHGKAGTRDFFNLHKFESETRFQRDEIEPDKLFQQKPVAEYDDLSMELIGQLPIIERISAYWKAGNINRALELADKSILSNDMNRTREVISLFTDFNSEKSLEIMKKHLGPSEDLNIRKNIIEAMAGMKPDLVIKPLSGLLKNQNSYVRRSAAEALVRIGTEESLGLLTTLIKDRSSYVRHSAAVALGRIGTEESLGLLTTLIKDQSSYVRRSAAVALGRIGTEESLGPLTTLIKDQDSSVRSSAAYALGLIGTEESLGLLTTLIKDQSPSVRRSAAVALGRIGTEESLGPLITLIKDQDWSVRSCAAEALGRIGPESFGLLTTLIKAQSPYVRSCAAEALGRIGAEESLGPLTTLIKDQSLYVRRSAAEVLGRIGAEESLGPLTTLIKDQSSSVRRSAAEALGRIGTEESLGLLKTLIKDQSLHVRRSAAEALGRIGIEESLGPLTTLIKDQESSVRRSAAEALGRIGTEESLGPLTTLIKDQSSSVRSSAAEAFGRIGTEESLGPLTTLIKDQKLDVRSSAAEAFGRIGTEKSLVSLTTLLKDQDSSMRKSAAEALGRIGTEESLGPLTTLIKDQKLDVRSSAAEALGRIGTEESLGPLTTLIKDQKLDVRRSAVEALGRIGTEESLGPLTTLIKDQSSYVRRYAVFAIGKIIDIKQTKSLKEIYKNKREDYSIRLAVASVLLRMGDTEGLSLLKKYFSSRNYEERKDLTEVLGKSSSKQGTLMLIKLLNDKAYDVREQAISSLSLVDDKASAPLILDLLNNPKRIIKEAAINALANIASHETFTQLEKIANNPDELTSTRLTAIKALGKIGNKEAKDALLKIFEKEKSDQFRYKTIRALGKARANNALSHLQKLLKDLETRKAKWRKIRDENTQSYTEEQIKDWRKRIETVKPKPHMEFELANAIAQTAPEPNGINLLSHPLSQVRKGAWWGLGKVGTPVLVEKLYNQRKQSSIPWFKYASYRAIDHILINIQANGGKEEMKQLEKFMTSIPEDERDIDGVHTRVKWTVDRIKARL